MNICKKACDTILYCSHPGVSYHEIDNLYEESGKSLCSKGYLSDQFIRPPVYILACFSHPNLIEKLTFKIDSYRNIVDRVAVRLVPPYAVKEKINENNYKIMIDSFKSLKKNIYIDFTKQETIPQVEINLVSKFARSQSDKGIFNVIYTNQIMAIMIELISTRNKTIPCLNSLKIYKSSERAVLEGYRKYKNMKNKKTDPKEETNQITSKSTPNGIGDPNASANIPKSVPIEILLSDECIDSISQELLVDPVRLPCGNFTNRDSILKCWTFKSADAPRLNPFTNMPLSNTQIEEILKGDEKKKQDVELRWQQAKSKIEEKYAEIIRPTKRPYPFSSVKKGFKFDYSDGSNDEM